MTRPRATWIDSHVGARLRLARQIAEQSQQDLAKTLKITFQQVQKYERGTNRMPVAQLLAASKALSQPLTFFVPDLYTSRGPESHGDQTEALAQMIAENAEEAALLKTFRNVKKGAVRRQILALVEELGRRET